MFKFEPCLPTRRTEVPTGPRDQARRLSDARHPGERVTKGDYDWSKRYPWIVESALKNRQKHFVIDGEAVVLGLDGNADFNDLHSRKHDHEVQLYAFDILALGGDDLRSLPLHLRKQNLVQLLARRPDGITVAPFERIEIGPDLFRAACCSGRHSRQDPTPLIPT
jgi:ATP-dependent DNA ligase